MSQFTESFPSPKAMGPARALLLAALLGAFACGPGGEAELTLGGAAADGQQSETLDLRSEDRAETVDVLSWNIEWFGDLERGPQNEALQQANAVQVLGQLNLDLVGLVEVVDARAFEALLEALPSYRGLLVTDPRVQGGAGAYSRDEQKLALLFKSRFRVEAARVVLTEASYDFAGRPPLEVQLAFEEGGRARTLAVLVTHFKAAATADGYARRTRAAAALEGYLDATYPSRWALVIGDFNDDLSRSIYQARPSPLAPLQSDGRYRFTTEALSQTRQPTTVDFPSTIDHHLATASLARRFVEGSARVIRPDVARYGTSTSDHYPVLTRYDLR